MGEIGVVADDNMHVVVFSGISFHFFFFMLRFFILLLGPLILVSRLRCLVSVYVVDAFQP